MTLRATKMFSAAFVIAAALALSTLTACDGFFVSNSATDHVTLSATALVLSSNNGTTGAESKALSATAVTVGGDSSDVTSTATWTSSNAAIATVNASGTVTAVAPGTATISAKSGGATGTATVIVVATSVGALAVTPASVSLHTTTGPKTAQLAATLTLGSGTLDVTQIADWSSDTTTIATVSSTGLVTGIANNTNILGTPSSAKVSATVLTASGTQSGSSTINVDPL
jgi:trimeric autotransporter adhesin